LHFTESQPSVKVGDCAAATGYRSTERVGPNYTARLGLTARSNDPRGRRRGTAEREAGQRRPR